VILAGDIGGTKTNLGLYDVQQGRLNRVAEKRYPSRDHNGLEEIVADFVVVTGVKATAAGFGIAGPVVDNRVHTGNLPWIVDGATMAKQLGLERVRLMNDLEATAFGISVMGPADLETLHAGAPAPQAPRVVIAAGTGLGEAILFWGETHSHGNRGWPRRFRTADRAAGGFMEIYQGPQRIREQRIDTFGKGIQNSARIPESVGAASGF
jgi:glucokinase